MTPKNLRALIVPAGIALALPAFAHLGSFAPADGYNLFISAGGNANWSDVTYYNAGQYGPNAGNGPGPTSAVPDSGLWTLQSGIGAFFPTAALRSANVGTAPPYPPNVPPGTVPAYIVGNHFPGRGGDGSNLAVRNDTGIGSGAIKYNYSIDTYDTGGPVPSSVTSGVVDTQFYFMPNPATPPNPGAHARDKFIMSFKDGGGNVGVEWGYADDNEVYWRAGSGPFTYTGIYANAVNWDGVKVSIDLTSDTFGIDYYDVSNNLWSPMVASGTALGTPMTNLTTLGWFLNDAVNSGIGGKNFFDDFSFNIPEPSTLVLGLFGVAALLRRRA